MSARITKADGTTELFQPEKLRSSLERAGATPGRAGEITKDMEKEIYDGITTNEIYRHAFASLKEEHHAAAARYSLKRAILDFGPSGFPFEAYLAELFRAEGYSAKIDQIIPGRCVDHEVDVVMIRENKTTYVEAKFHNTAALKSDLKTVLYVQARLEDIAAHKGNPEHMNGLIATNTKFTSKAVQYGVCAGIELLSWEYPLNHTLHDRIDRAKVYPITALTTLSRDEKISLLNEKIVLCTGLPLQSEALQRSGVHGKRADAIFKEAAELCVLGKDI